MGNDALAADWDRFANSVAGRFADVTLDGFADAVHTLAKAAPRQQIVKGVGTNRRLDFAEVVRPENGSDEQYVLLLLRTARNNLFHGGKYPDGPVDEIARNRVILKAALTVLEGCYSLHPGLAAWARDAA